MMYSALLIMSDELNNICRPRVTKKCFRDGYLIPDREDVRDSLESAYQMPVLSIRKGRTDSRNPDRFEVIILFANGYISKDGKRVLNYDSEATLKQAFSDIQRETFADRDELIENFIPGPKCSEEVWNSTINWLLF